MGIYALTPLFEHLGFWVKSIGAPVSPIYAENIYHGLVPPLSVPYGFRSGRCNESQIHCGRNHAPFLRWRLRAAPMSPPPPESIVRHGHAVPPSHHSLVRCRKALVGGAVDWPDEYGGLVV
jgi:hypothetical protein